MCKASACGRVTAVRRRRPQLEGVPGKREQCWGASLLAKGGWRDTR